MKALSSSADIVIGGGAAGAGKTFSLLLEPIRHIGVKGFGAVCFRRTSPMIRSEGGLWDASEKIYRLIQYKFTEYLNLLYIIDVSEQEIKKLDGSDLVFLAEQVAFLILKREWQKVWFRNKY